MRRAVCGLLLAISLWAQGVHPITGRKYAGVMGVGGADWLVRPEREQEEQPDLALDAIGIAEGSDGRRHRRGRRLHDMAPGAARRTARQGVRQRHPTADARAC